MWREAEKESPCGGTDIIQPSVSASLAFNHSGIDKITVTTPGCLSLSLVDLYTYISLCVLK